MRRAALMLALAAAAALPLGGCVKRTLPPGDVGVCYHVVPQKDGKTLRYNRLVEHVPSLEQCAANLEAMRIRFLRLGGSNREIYGAYQGNFIFIEKEGVFTAPSLEEHRYLALVRTGDGRLAIPGAMPPGAVPQ
jgi:hypothetical protein